MAGHHRWRWPRAWATNQGEPRHSEQGCGRSLAWALRLGVSAAVLALASCGGSGGSGGSGGALDDPGPPPLPTGRVSTANPVLPTCSAGVSPSSTAYGNAEVEPSLARAPAPAQLLLAAWQQDRWNDGGARAIVSAVSGNGGGSWSLVLHPMSRCGGALAGSAGDFERASDPWVDVGADGTLHLMALAFSGSALQAGSSNAMLASRSTDGGRTWSAPWALARDGATLFNDKNTLTVDTLDPNFVYAVWDRLDVAGYGPTLLARSLNAGASWEAAREIYRPPTPSGATAQTIGNRVLVVKSGAQRGTLVNVFTQIDVNAGSTRNTVRVLRSSDQGLTWGPAITIGEHRGVGAKDPTTGVAIRDGAIVPTAAAAPDGSLWVAWQDSRFSGGLRDGIAVSRSLDGGLTWSPIAQASNSGTAAAFTPTLSVRDDGLVGLMYFDLRPDTSSAGTLLAAVWLASTRDGVSWAEAPVWSTFDMSQAPNARGLFLGDYMGLVSDGAQFVPLLALSSSDTNNRTDVYLLRVNAATSLVRSALAVESPLSDAEFQARRQAFTQRVMERRLPEWGRRVKLKGAAERLVPEGSMAPGK